MSHENGVFTRFRDNYDEVINDLQTENYGGLECTRTSDGWVFRLYTDRPDHMLRTVLVPMPHLMWDVVHHRDRNSGLYPVGDCLHVDFDVNTGATFPRAKDWFFQREYIFGSGPPVQTKNHWLEPVPYIPLNWAWMLSIMGDVGVPDSLGGGTVPDNLRSDLSEQAWNYFSDIFPSSLSFGEFIQGLFELRGLLPEIKDSILGTLSSGYLNKTFGWDNLLSDLKTLSGLFSSVVKRMNYLKRTWGIPTRLGFARHNIVDFSSQIGTVYDLSGCSGNGLDGHRAFGGVKLKSAQADYHASCWVLQELDYIDGLTGFLRVATGALGLNNPVKTFWSLLPFSFVVDWFTNVSEHLDNLTRLNPPIGWSAGRLVHSVKVRRTFEIYQDIPIELSINNSVNIPRNCELTVTRYDRYAGLSFHWELLDPNGLTGNQLTLLLAMLSSGG